MKEHTFSLNELGQRTDGIESGSQNFIFSFSASQFQNVKEIGLDLIFKKKIKQKVVLSPSNNSDEDRIMIVHRGGEATYARNLFGGNDTNVVVRVEKIAPISFTTYVNDQFIATHESIKPETWANRVGVAGVEIKTHNSQAEPVDVTLTVFRETETPTALTFATRMRNPSQTNSFDNLLEAIVNVEGQVDDGENAEEEATAEQGAKPLGSDQAVETGERGKPMADSETNVHGYESQMAEEARRQALANLEKVLANNQKVMKEQENSITDLGKAIANHRKEFEAVEREVHLLKKAFLDFEKAVVERDHGQKLQDQLLGPSDRKAADVQGKHSSALDVNPPDADAMKISATVAWPRAIRHVLGATVACQLQKTHDTLMGDWVVARDDNLSSSAYDFFVYSHGVTWPKVALQSATGDDVTKIWERHEAIMEALN